MAISTINLSRRRALKAMGASIATATFSACSNDQSSSAAPTTPKPPPWIIGKDGRKVLAWQNWSGNQSCQPTSRHTPKNEAGLAELIKNSGTDPLRFVGSGHSFSSLVPTDHTLLSLARFRGVQNIDNNNGTATIGGGTTLSRIGDPLWDEGFALRNMPDIDMQSLAGAIATGTHGTGIKFGSMSDEITGLRLVTANGDVLSCSAVENSELFEAARLNLGVLGAVTSVDIKVQPKFYIEENIWVLPIKEALASAEAMRDQHRHFEMYFFPHADYVLMITLDEVDQPAPASEQNHTEGDQSLLEIAELTDTFPWIKSFILNFLIKDVEPSQRSNRSYKIYGNVRNIRFNETEYSVPAEKGLDCISEILDTIKKQNIDIIFPIEYRYIKNDNIWLSPYYQRDGCAISCHNFHDRDYKAYFKSIEPVFKKYAGRPHWGKINTLNKTDFAAMYPNWEAFNRVRQQLDPSNRLLNQYLASLFA